MPPVLSVCLTTYNRANYLREAIQSVLNQTFEDFELLIGDNGSEDGTEEVVNSFNDPRLSYHRRAHNLGSFENARLLLEASQGKYITFFHDDDVMLSHHLERSVKALDLFPTVGFVHAGYITINERGDRSGSEACLCLGEDYKNDFLMEGRRHLERLLLGGSAVCCPTVVVRRECFEKLGFADHRIKYANDYELWMRFSSQYDVVYLRGPNMLYRIHSTNDSSALRVNRAMVKCGSWVHSHAFYSELYKAKMKILNTCEFTKDEKKDYQFAIRRDLSRAMLCDANSLCHLGLYKESVLILNELLRIRPSAILTMAFFKLTARYFFGEKVVELIKSAVRHVP